MRYLSKQKFVMIVLAISAGIIFAIDVLIPFGLIIWLSYMPLIFISVFTNNRKFIKLLAFSICSFIIIAFFFDISEMKGFVPWGVSLFHRFFGILIISILGYISCKLLETREIAGKLEKLVKVCAWTKKIKIGDEWITIEEFMKKYLDKNVTHGISPEAYEKMLDESNLTDAN